MVLFIILHRVVKKFKSMIKIPSYDFSPLYKREGNWAELAFAMTSGIVTGDAPVSYWPIGN